MWLFSQRGMFSIVQHKDNPDILIVKARVKGDIEKYFPAAEIERNESFDYLYRANLPRNTVVAAISEMARNIDYASFKGNMEDRPRRLPFYIRIWECLIDMQETFKVSEKSDAKAS